MKLYHRTDRGEAIMREGFRDAGSRYGTTTWHEGVWLSDSSLAVNEGVNGDDLLVVEIVDAPALAEHEWVEEGKPYREWLIPAALVNRCDRVLLPRELGTVHDLDSQLRADIADAMRTYEDNKRREALERLKRPRGD